MLNRDGPRQLGGHHIGVCVVIQGVCLLSTFPAHHALYTGPHKETLNPLRYTYVHSTCTHTVRQNMQKFYLKRTPLLTFILPQKDTFVPSLPLNGAF